MTEKLFELTADNYYSQEADQAYLSCSQYDDFMDCEAAALAKIQGRYTPKKTDAFIVGNYFHSYMEGAEAHRAFCEEHFDEIYKTKTVKGETVITGKYAPFVVADRMIKCAEDDPVIKGLMDAPGEVEKVMTGKLFGIYPWKIRLDKYFPDRRLIIDWKTVANIHELTWNSAYGQKVSFVENFGYLRRAAVYSEIEKQYTGKATNPMFSLVCISKQEVPDKEIINLYNNQRQAVEIEDLHETVHRIQEIKDGKRLPLRCGHCEYCRATKRLKGMLDYWELESGNHRPREEDYAIDQSVSM